MESPLLQQLCTQVKDRIILSKDEIHLTSLVGQGKQIAMIRVNDSPPVIRETPT